MSLRTIEIIPSLEITIVQPQTITIDTITINSVIDDGANIIANVQLPNGLVTSLTLYTSYDYEPIQNFSDADINARVIELAPTIRF